MESRFVTDPRKNIGQKEIEVVVAKIARIPPKNVSKDDAEVLRDLESKLKTVVFGQDKAISALSSAILLNGVKPPQPVHRMLRWRLWQIWKTY